MFSQRHKPTVCVSQLLSNLLAKAKRECNIIYGGKTKRFRSQRERVGTNTEKKHLYRLVKLHLLLQVLLHDPVVVIDTIVMEVVHLSCGRGGRGGRGRGVVTT